MTNDIEVTCPNCRHAGRVERGTLGKHIHCPSCNKPFVVGRPTARQGGRTTGSGASVVFMLSGIGSGLLGVGLTFMRVQNLLDGSLTVVAAGSIIAGGLCFVAWGLAEVADAVRHSGRPPTPGESRE